MVCMQLSPGRGAFPSHGVSPGHSVSPGHGVFLAMVCLLATAASCVGKLQQGPKTGFAGMAFSMTRC